MIRLLEIIFVTICCYLGLAFIGLGMKLMYLCFMSGWGLV